MSPPRPPELPPRSIVITDRVFAMAALSTLLVALGLAMMFGMLAYFSMHETASLRAALDQSQLANAACAHNLEHSNGRLEQMEKLVSLVSGKPFPTGGVGGPR